MRVNTYTIWNVHSDEVRIDRLGTNIKTLPGLRPDDKLASTSLSI